MEDKLDNINVFGDDGHEYSYDVILTYHGDETNKDYMIITNWQKGVDDKTQFIISSYNIKDNKIELDQVTDPQELKVTYDLLNNAKIISQCKLRDEKYLAIINSHLQIIKNSLTFNKAGELELFNLSLTDLDTIKKNINLITNSECKNYLSDMFDDIVEQIFAIRTLDNPDVQNLQKSILKIINNIEQINSLSNNFNLLIQYQEELIAYHSVLDQLKMAENSYKADLISYEEYFGVYNYATRTYNYLMELKDQVAKEIVNINFNLSSPVKPLIFFRKAKDFKQTDLMSETQKYNKMLDYYFNQSKQAQTSKLDSKEALNLLNAFFQVKQYERWLNEAKQSIEEKKDNDEYLKLYEDNYQDLNTKFDNYTQDFVKAVKEIPKLSSYEEMHNAFTQKLEEYDDALSDYQEIYQKYWQLAENYQDGKISYKEYADYMEYAVKKLANLKSMARALKNTRMKIIPSKKELISTKKYLEKSLKSKWKIFKYANLESDLKNVNALIERRNQMVIRKSRDLFFVADKPKNTQKGNDISQVKDVKFFHNPFDKQKKQEINGFKIVSFIRKAIGVKPEVKKVTITNPKPVQPKINDPYQSIAHQPMREYVQTKLNNKPNPTSEELNDAMLDYYNHILELVDQEEEKRFAR